MSTRPLSLISKLALCSLVGLLNVQTLSAEDWPQWRGTNRDGVWSEEGIVEAVPSSGLKVRWRTKIGNGYSGPSVANGKVFVTDHVDNPERERVLCFDEKTGELIWTHEYSVDYWDMEYGNGPRASPLFEADRLYTLGTEGDMRCLDAETGKVIWKKDIPKEYDADTPRYGVSVAPIIEGDFIIISIGGQPDASVIAFDKKTGEERWKALDDDPAYSAPIIVEAAGTRQLILWTAENLSSLNPQTGEVYWQDRWRAGFDPAQATATPVFHNQQLLLVSGWNRGARLYTLDQNKPEATMTWRTRSQPTTAISSPMMIDDAHFISVDLAGDLCCSNMEKGDEVWRTGEMTGKASFGTAHFVKHQDRFFMFNQRGHLISAKVTLDGYEETGRALLVEPTAGHRAQGPESWSHPAFANQHVIARNDRELVRASLAASDYKESDFQVASSEHQPELLSEFVGRNAAMTLDTSSDGELLALGTWSGETKLLDLSTGEPRKSSPKSFRNRCSAITFSPDQKLLAYVGGSEFEHGSNDYQSSGKVFLWDITEEKILFEMKGHTSNVTCAVFSPDGRTLATGSADLSVRLWDVSTGKERNWLEGHTDAVWALAYSPDGKSLISTGWDQTVKIWDTATGTLRKEFSAHDEEILCLAISPDGTTLATGSADWTVQLWNVETGQQKAVLKGHQGGIYGIVFSPDGKQLATGSGDETIKLWELDRNQTSTTLRGHRSGITDVVFTANGKKLISSGRGDAVRIWKLSE